MDAFLFLGTGDGKSLCYIAFSLFYERVYQPQLAHVLIFLLWRNRLISFFISKGFTATYISKDAYYDDGIRFGEYQIVFTSPETLLQNGKWRNMLSYSKSFPLFVVDEAHIVVHYSGICIYLTFNIVILFRIYFF